MMAGKKRSISSNSDTCALHKEWDEALCPICMEHPHNAVLLLCISHGKGCRPYVCDTSYRHSNCLDRYRKMKMDSNPLQSNPEIPEQQNPSNNSATRLGQHVGDDLVEALEALHPTGESSRDPGYNHTHNQDLGIAETELSLATTEKTNLKCPLCRGDVQGWKVIEEARKYLNLKIRSCSRESCSLVGNYRELRRHARSLHPSARPAEIDPSRERAWRRFEHQREYDDIVSAIQSAIPGAVVFGDYVIENGDNDRIPTERGRTSGELNGPFFTTFFLFQMLGSMDSRSRSRGTWSRHRQSTGLRYHWGENLLGMRNESDEDDDELDVINMSSDDLPARRRHRRLTRTRSSRDQP